MGAMGSASLYGTETGFHEQVASVLQRTAVDPQPDCDSKWIPTDANTGHRGMGYKRRWYTPGWPWPFNDGAGVVVGECVYLRGETTPTNPSDCCSVIFGNVKGAKVAQRLVGNTSGNRIVTSIEEGAMPPSWTLCASVIRSCLRMHHFVHTFRSVLRPLIIWC